MAYLFDPTSEKLITSNAHQGCRTERNHLPEKQNQGPVVLVVMDGWGLREQREHNAVALAATPEYDALCRRFPTSRLDTSGTDVGLPEGTMGNSEVGHLNLGAGRVVWQQLMQIHGAIDEGTFRRNPALLESMQLARSRGSRLHLFGLISEASVHSSEKHYLELIEMAAENGIESDKVLFHAFTDGRDSPPHSARRAIQRLHSHLQRYGGRIGTVIGRYYSMDRDKRWPRTRLAYEAMVRGEAEFQAGSGLEAVESAYRRAAGHPNGAGFPAESDEFIRPTVIADSDGPIAKIRDGDVVISFNHRADRPRQIIRALTEKDLADNTRDDPNPSFTPRYQPRTHLLTMTDYRAGFDCPVAFNTSPLTGTIAEIVSQSGLRQFHTAETEKYPHVTFFFNGGREAPFQGEDRYMARSPEVATYDLKPEMSALEVTEHVVEAIRSGRYGFVVINYANGDMAGHSGVLKAAIRAVEVVDTGVGRVAEAVQDVGGEALITADHGNCEQMWDEESGGPHTAHTTNPVPCILVSERFQHTCLADGRLADVAPTLLSLLGLKCPDEMEGENLVGRSDWEKM